MSVILHRAGLLSSAAAAAAYQQILDLATDDGWTAVYDPTNPDTRTTRTSGGSTFLSAVADGLGNWPDYVQATEANQPELSTGAFGQLDAILGDGSAAYMDQASAVNQAQPVHHIAVARRTGDLSDNRLLFDNVGTGGPDQHAIAHNTAGKYFISGGTVVSGGTTDQNDHVYSALLSGASSYLRVDGTEVLSGDAGSNGVTTHRWLTNVINTTFWAGPAGVHLYFAGTPSDAVRDRMEDLIHNLTGIAKA